MACSCSGIRPLLDNILGHHLGQHASSSDFGKSKRSSKPPRCCNSAPSYCSLRPWRRPGQDGKRSSRMGRQSLGNAQGYCIATLIRGSKGDCGTATPPGRDDTTMATDPVSQARESDDASEFRPGRRLVFGAVLSGLALSSLGYSSSASTSDTSTTTATGAAPLGPLKNLLPSLPGNLIADPQEKQSRVYDATVLGEPVTVGADKTRVWDRLLAARVVYLGESELVPDADDKLLELEIVHTLREKCSEQQRPVLVALEIFSLPLQPQLNQYLGNELTDEDLKTYVPLWPDERWNQVQPLLRYCRDNGIRLLACGTPPEVLRRIQADGVQALTDVDQKVYVPRSGSRHGALSLPFPVLRELFQRGPYQFAQARIVAQNIMAKVVNEALQDGGVEGLLVLITSASHVQYGSKGSGVPARVPKFLQRKTQVVVLLNPERQHIRREGDVPEADFLWYSAAKGCTRNCFNRAEVARVMDAAGRRRDGLPQDLSLFIQDLQAGLEHGLVSPEVLQNFFELDRQPFLAELARRFQGLRERWLADPRFLQRLAIEESISITTTLIAQYERRGPRFWQELDYVITDSVRGAVVDFFTVWLPAPRLSFRSLISSSDAGGFGTLEGLKGLLVSLPDNAFQRARGGENWDLRARVLSVIVGGVKLFGVGFVSSLGTVTSVNALLAVRQRFGSIDASNKVNKRSPVFKTALVYGSFLGTSANLRYQAIAGLVEHWVADYLLASEPLGGNVLSFVARTANSYWGTQQWVDLARVAGLQAHQEEAPLQQQSSQSHESKNKLGTGGSDILEPTSAEALINSSTNSVEALINSPEDLGQEQALESSGGIRQ